MIAGLRTQASAKQNGHGGWGELVQGALSTGTLIISFTRTIILTLTRTALNPRFGRRTRRCSSRQGTHPARVRVRVRVKVRVRGKGGVRGKVEV